LQGESHQLLTALRNSRANSPQWIDLAIIFRYKQETGRKQVRLREGLVVPTWRCQPGSICGKGNPL